MAIGTDVNFGEITRQLFASMTRNPNVQLHLSHEVRDIVRNERQLERGGGRPGQGGTQTSVKAKFVFIGAGGGALKLLQKSGIPEAEGYAGFPVGGQFLMTDNPDTVARHQAKLYGKASVGAPPMSVPHLDTR
jgi:malate dehydrogenase (quinone)